MQFRIQNLIGVCLAIWLVVSASCNKEQLLASGGEVRFSTDTLKFDTVFTAAGSFTLGIKIYNPQNQKINLTSVRMERGASSFFKINVNGIAGSNITNQEIAANDSIYVFATVNIDPSNDNNPFLIEENLVATLNGRDYTIPFTAFGQNAHYIYGRVIENDTTFTADRPWVIVHSAQIDTGKTLTILPGARVYMHADSRLIVSGRLNAIGTKTDSIIFQGDRLDRGYFGGDIPGEWGGIYFDGMSTGNVMEHVILKNGGNSALGATPALIQVNRFRNLIPDNVVQLTMNRVTLANSIGYGLVSFAGNVRGDNLLIHSCGAQTVAFFEGGNATFNHSSFVIQSQPYLTHADNPAVAFLNYRDTADAPGAYYSGALNVTLNNCIIWGSLEDELLVARKTATSAYNVAFNNCLLKTKTATAIADGVTMTDTLKNRDPQFADVSKQDYHLKSNTSPAYNRGRALSSTNQAKDRDEVDRNGRYDLGCYQVR